MSPSLRPKNVVITTTILMVGLVLFMVSVVYATRSSTAQDIVLPPMTPELNLGKMSYDRYCAACHGVNASGTDKGPTFLHRVYHPGHHGDGAFFLAPKNGVRAHHWRFGDMPPVKEVTDSQIEKIIIYVRSLQKANGVF